MNARLEWAAPDEGAPLVVFDMDGTLCHNDPKMDFMRPGSVLRGCRPNPAVVRRLLALWESNTCHIAVLTARNRGILGDVTRLQLAQFLGPEVEDSLYAVWDSSIGSIGSMGPRPFWLAVREFKAFHLTNSQASVFIGDTHHDMDAARAAGVPFMSALEFGRGERIPGLQPPEWRCASWGDGMEDRLMRESDERASSLGGCICNWVPWGSEMVIENYEPRCPEHGGE